MKKIYTSPEIVCIGDMVNNTLGSSGDTSDNGTRQAGGENNTSSNNNKNTKQSNSNSNGDSFQNDSFK